MKIQVHISWVGQSTKGNLNGRICNTHADNVHYYMRCGPCMYNHTRSNNVLNDVQWHAALPPLAMTITIVTINMKKSKLENPTCVCHQRRSLRQCPALWSYWTGWKPAFITMMMRILIIIVTFIVIITSIVIVTLSTRAKRELKRLPREKHLLSKTKLASRSGWTLFDVPFLEIPFELHVDGNR